MYTHTYMITYYIYTICMYVCNTMEWYGMLCDVMLCACALYIHMTHHEEMVSLRTRQQRGK